MTPKAVEKAKADVRRLAEAEFDLSHRRAAKLAEIGAPDGDALLAGELAGEGEAMSVAVEKVTRATAEASALASAVDAARRARVTAITAAWRAEAELKRQEVAQLRVDAQTRSVKTDAMLAELLEHEGEEYFSASHVNAIVARAMGAPDNTGAMFGAVHLTTTTGKLQTRADELEAEAAELETRAVRRAGSVSGSSVDELFAALAADPFVIGPTLEAITAWAEKAAAEARAPWRMDRLSRHVPVDDAAWCEAAPLFTLAFVAAGIVAANSRVTVRPVPTARPPSPDSPARVIGIHDVH